MTPIRASSLDRVLACNGSLVLVPLVAPREGEEATEGTALHWIGHAKLKQDAGAAGEIGPAPAMPASLSFSAWIAEYYTRFVLETVPPDWSLECEVGLSYMWDQFNLSGHIDCLALNADATEAIGFDLKTGYDPVDAADMNEQVLGYCCLLLRAYPTLRKITFWIVQPRNDEDEGFQRCSSVTVEGGVLESVPVSLENRLNAALANRMEVSTSMRACKWCPAAPQCPAATALRELMKATLTPEYLAAVKATPDDAALADWVIAGRTLNRPIEDAEKMLKARIKAAGFVDAGQGVRITIKEEGGSYSFPDPVGFYHATRRIIQDDAKYAETVKPSVTKTKEMIAAVTGLPKTAKVGESAASVFDAQLKPLVVQGVRERMVFQ